MKGEDKTTDYAPVPIGDDMSTGTSDNESTSESAFLFPNSIKTFRRARSWKQAAVIAGSSVLLIILLVLAAFGLYYLTTLDRACLERTSVYSPALREISPKYRDVRFNGTLDWPSPYRGPPSPEIDAAWLHLENVKVMTVTADDLLRSGFDLDSVRIPEEYGGGYMASLEINHQLHCLNFLRMATHLDYYQFRAVEFTDEPAMIRTHLDHCIEMIRQNIMCNSDVGIIAHRWVKHYDRPYPNFNTVHKCRNFDEVLDYAYSREVPTPRGYLFKPEPDDKIFPTPP